MILKKTYFLFAGSAITCLTGAVISYLISSSSGEFKLKNEEQNNLNASNLQAKEGKEYLFDLDFGSSNILM